MSFAQNPQGSRRRIDQVPRFELDEIVVTASRIEEPILMTPRNVTVITKEDIEQATSNHVVDLIARESGVTLKNYYGHDKQAGIDIRGMGATSISNVIVLVDGMRLNPPDLAGPDLSSIPLDQIERIEILRGAGSVFYGNGAVGGVINIITKKDADAPGMQFFSSYGSYDTYDIRTSLNGRIGQLILNTNWDYYDSKCYRENGDLEKKDASIYAGYDMNEFIDLALRASFHEDAYGLPGPVKDDPNSIGKEYLYLDRALRRLTYRSPEDSGETTDRQYIANLEIDLDDMGTITAQRGYRFRKNDYILGFNPLMTKAEQMNRIDEDTRDLSVQYHVPYKLRALEHRFWCGAEFYETDYLSERLQESIRKNSRVKNFGVFLSNEWGVTEDLMIRLGYRHNRYKDRNREDSLQVFGPVKVWVNGSESSRSWWNDAYETGMTYHLRADTTLFGSLSTSFRVPNVDELAQPDEDLHPQKGKHMEIGMRQRIKGLTEFSLTLFHIEITDEIYYSEINGNSTNRNYDEKTVREGLETDFKLYPTDALYIWGNYALTEAGLKDTGSFMPLVPRHKATAGLEWRMSGHFLLSLTGTFVGSIYDGSDFENDRFERIGGYEVLDGKLTYQYKGLRCFMGVNNILDELYSTIAYSGAHYPMPARNLYGGIEWKF